MPRVWSLPCAVVALAFASCGGASHSKESIETAQCRRAPSLNQGDAAIVPCSSASALVSCSLSNGETEIFISDAPIADSCKNECESGEYAVACGVIGPSRGAAASPPAGCAPLSMTPAGIGFACCPCL